MTCRDRTLEFQSACKSLQGRPVCWHQSNDPMLLSMSIRQRFHQQIWHKRRAILTRTVRSAESSDAENGHLWLKLSEEHFFFLNTLLFLCKIFIQDSMISDKCVDKWPKVHPNYVTEYIRHWDLLHLCKWFISDWFDWFKNPFEHNLSPKGCRDGEDGRILTAVADFCSCAIFIS